MRTLLVVSLTALVAACAASPTYVFLPTRETVLEDAPGDVDGRAAAVYRVPADRPRGEVRIAAVGVTRWKVRDGDGGRVVRTLQLRLVVHNGDREVWTLEPRSQKAVIDDAESEPRVATCDGQALPIAVLMPGDTRTIDLYYEVPAGTAVGARIPFSLAWRVETPGRVVARATTSFERHELPPPRPAPVDRQRMLQNLARASAEDDGMPQPGRGDAFGLSSGRN